MSENPVLLIAPPAGCIGSLEAIFWLGKAAKAGVRK